VHQRRAERYSQYLQNPVKIIDVLDSVIKKLSGQCQAKATVDQTLQLTEIAKTIARLKDSGTKIPDELRNLKIGLSAVVTEQQNLLLILQSLELRLSRTITDLRARIKQLAECKQNKTKSRKRYVKRTSPTLLRKEICRALRELGGTAKKSEVIDKIRANMEEKFKPDDTEPDSKGISNWERWVGAERLKMVKEGILKSGSNQRVWELRRR
jgi:hypothetical protein